MAFQSSLRPAEYIITDRTPLSDVMVEDDPKVHGRGLKFPRGRRSYKGVADAFPSELLIPVKDIPEWIEEKERTKTNISDICIAGGLECKDQDGKPYCWVHGPTHCVEITTFLQQNKVITLSATAVGAVIKNFKEQGGWGRDAIEFIAENGIPTTEAWPENEILKKYNTKECWEAAKQNIVTEWIALTPRNNQQIASLVLRNIPVAVGYNWWGHEVTIVDCVWLNGRLAWRIRNSWGMGWKDRGFAIIEGNRMLADDAVAAYVKRAA